MVVKADSAETLEEARERREKELLESLVLFPGSIVEYEIFKERQTFKRYNVEIVDTKRPEKGVFLGEPRNHSDTDLIAHLMEEKGVEALVNVSYKQIEFGVDGHNSLAYGLPVRRRH